METIFTITFPFKDNFEYVNVPASMFAMDVAIDIMGDGMLDAACDHNLCFGHRFEHQGKSYLVTFAYDSTKALNIYETTSIDPDSGNYDEKLIADNVPYNILKVFNSDTKTEIYNVTDCI